MSPSVIEFPLLGRKVDGTLTLYANLVDPGNKAVVIGNIEIGLRPTLCEIAALAFRIKLNLIGNLFLSSNMILDIMLDLTQ